MFTRGVTTQINVHAREMRSQHSIDRLDNLDLGVLPSHLAVANV